SYIHAEGLSAGELKHGFIALVEPTLPTIAIVTNDEVKTKMLANIAEVKARGGPVIAIANLPLPEADATIVVPNVGSDYLQPLVNNIGLQLLAYYTAKTKQLDIDQPRNLAKSVTVE
ncbi:SIS domain-containing protein, partial [Candidatus Microgenomates bacterium]|nr:SIS domain-containing protein [Candidatus Microgenomates bacterium]